MNIDISKFTSKENLSVSEVNQLRKTLEHASSSYYNSGVKILSDGDFDVLQDILEANGENLDIGAPVASGTVSEIHTYPNLVGSLNKANSIDDVYNYFEGKLGLDNNYEFFVSLKFDGNSGVGEFKANSLATNRVLTRGSNGKGLDITGSFNDLKLDSSLKVDFGIKFEVISTYTDFDKALDKLGISYANPRSFVSGKLSDNDKSLSKYLTPVPIGFTINKPIPIKKQYEYIKLLMPDAYNKFILPYSLDFKGNLDEFCDELESFMEHILQVRDSLDFMIDGLVIEVSDPDLIVENLVSSKPYQAVALKFPYREAPSKVIGFEFDVSESSTGRITPMVLIDPVEFYGNVQRRISVANYLRFNDLQLGIGSPVLVQYRNDTLSYVEPMESDMDIEPYPFPTNCPICNGDIRIQVNDKGIETLAYCSNKDCSNKKIGKYLRYVSTLDIKGVGASTLEKLIKAGLLEELVDLYKLEVEDILKVEEGLGEVSANNIIKAISSVQPFDYQLLASLGITNFHLSKSKVLLSTFTLDEVFKYDPDTELYNFETFEFQRLFESLDTFNIKTYNHFKEYFTDDNINEFFNLLDHLEMINGGIANLKDIMSSKTNTYTFCITGSLNRPRKEITKMIESYGSKVTGGVTSKTDYLVANESSTNSKYVKAVELGIPIITEDDIEVILKLEE